MLQLRLENKEHWQKRQKEGGEEGRPWVSSVAIMSVWQVSLIDCGILCSTLEPQYVTGPQLLALGHFHHYLCFPHFWSCPHLSKTVSVLNFPAVNS